MRTPKYRKHSSRDIAFVEWQGKREYLPGRFDSPESRNAYKTFLQVHCGISPPAPQRPVTQGLTVVKLLASFLVHLQHQENGDTQGIYSNFRSALKPFAAEYGHELAASLGPLSLKRWQEKLAARGLSRGYISACSSYIRSAFRWGVSEELIPASVWHGLQAVAGLKAGKTPAKERKKRWPVPLSYVEATLPFLSPHVSAMVQLQWFSGARSQSVVMAHCSQFSRDGDFLLWRPRHKTESQGIEIVLPLGPRAQAVLAPFLAADGWLFSPRAISSHRRYGERYTTRSYYSCVRTAIRRLNSALAETCTPPIPRWFPHQLRHSKGHLVRSQFGLEAVQAVLGHQNLNTSEIYSAKRMELARLVALQTG